MTWWRYIDVSWLLWLFFDRLALDQLFIAMILIIFFTCQVGDLQRPLVSHDENLIQGQSSEVSREFDLEEACFQNEGLLRSSLTEGRGVYKPRLPSSSSSPHLAQGKVFQHPSSLSSRHS